MKPPIFTTVMDKYFWLDGGSMFGVVPRVVWERFHPADERHRIQIATRSLVVRHNGRVILCDMGIGNKLSAETIEFYRVDMRNGDLYTRLFEIGIERGDVTDVFFTHLHFDHAGCATIFDDSGKVVPAFPNATYYVQRAQYEWAINPVERDRDSYNPADFVPLYGAGQLKLLEGAEEVIKGVSVEPLGGHTPGMQLIRFDFAGASVVYTGDLFPFASHLRPSWIMAYDLNPLKTLEEKKRIMERAERERWILVYEHDPDFTATTVIKHPRKNSWQASEKITLEELG
ncbi:MAG: MBL fold metallo-hydrolase [Myxococcota bacterium]